MRILSTNRVAHTPPGYLVLRPPCVPITRRVCLELSDSVAMPRQLELCNTLSLQAKLCLLLAVFHPFDIILALNPAAAQAQRSIWWISAWRNSLLLTQNCGNIQE